MGRYVPTVIRTINWFRHLIKKGKYLFLNFKLPSVPFLLKAKIDYNTNVSNFLYRKIYHTSFTEFIIYFA